MFGTDGQGKKVKNDRNFIIKNKGTYVFHSHIIIINFTQIINSIFVFTMKIYVFNKNKKC